MPERSSAFQSVTGLVRLTPVKTHKFVLMPTLLATQGFLFFFYRNETGEPAHVHVGKIWLEPQLQMVYLNGFTKSEEKRILQIVEMNATMFKAKWYEYVQK